MKGLLSYILGSKVGNVDWTTITGPELLARVQPTDRTYLRIGLSFILGNEEEAMERWPDVFRHRIDIPRFNVRCVVTNESLKRELYSIDPSGDLYDEEAVRCMLRDNAVHPSLVSTDLGRAFADPRLCNVPTYERVFLHLRWGADNAARDLFVRLGDVHGSLLKAYLV